MFRKLGAYFKGKSALKASLDKTLGPATETDLLLAAAVILIEVASIDDDIDPTEAEQICSLLTKEFHISEEDLPELVEVAASARDEHERVDEFISCLNENFSKAQKNKLLAMVWKVVIADGKIETFEKQFATNLKFKLRIDNVDAQRARKMAEDGKI